MSLLLKAVKRVITLSDCHADQQTSRLLQRQFLEAFENFGKDFVKSCSQEENAASLPLAVNIFIDLSNKLIIDNAPISANNLRNS